MYLGSWTNKVVKSSPYSECHPKPVELCVSRTSPTSRAQDLLLLIFSFLGGFFLKFPVFVKQVRVTEVCGLDKETGTINTFMTKFTEVTSLDFC